MNKIPKIVGTVQDRVINPGKEFIKNSKEPLKRFVKQPGDSERLINETEEEEVDQVDLSNVPQAHQSNIYSYEPTSRATNLHNRALQVFERAPCCCKKKRWQIAIMAHIGFLIGFGIRCNLGAARDRMFHNYTDSYTNVTEAAPFPDWKPSILGVIEGAFFYGYIVTQLPAGFLAAKFPANKMFGIAIGGASFLNLLVPGAFQSGYGMVIFILIMQGLVQGVSYPACHGIWRYWAPPLERSKLATTALTGSYAGAVLGLPVSSVLTAYCGWQSSFYFYGIAGCIWFVFWWGLSFEKPACHPTISDEEKVYIETSLGDVSQLPPKLSNIPWKAIATSKPVYAIIVANVCRSWTFYLLLNHQLTYFKEKLNYRISTGGWIASVPHVVMAVVVLCGGQLADYLRSHKILSTTAVRKIFNCGGFGLEGLFLIVCGFSKTSTGAVVALVFAVGFSGFAISGYNVNHLDIAPRYASILMGISNGIGTFSGMICPVVTERITAAYGKKGWETIFLLAGLIHFTGITFFAIFASGEKQPWAEPPVEEETWKPTDNTGDKLNNYGAAGTINGSASYGTVDQTNMSRPFDPNEAWGDEQSNYDQTYGSNATNYAQNPPTAVFNQNYGY